MTSIEINLFIIDCIIVFCLKKNKYQSFSITKNSNYYITTCGDDK